jgi:lipid-binding SYLF domain-containing protein
MNFLRTTTAMLMLMLAVSSVQAAEDYSDTIKIFKSSPTGQKFFASAYGYAVFPTIGKGGFGIGGAHGKGQVYRSGAVTGKTSMSQVSIGFQAGGQSYSQVVFFENKKAYDAFTAGEFEFNAGVSAIAINASVGANAGTTGTSANTGANKERNRQTDASYSSGMAVLTVAKGGLMYEASVAGQKYKYEAL